MPKTNAFGLLALLVVFQLLVVAPAYSHAQRNSKLSETIDDRPIVGVLTQPMYSSEKSYIAASYVKFVESGGARVVALHYDSSAEELHRLFKGINGILFPGGGASIASNSTFFQSALFLWNLALEENDRGVHFPIWGTCLGFELIHELVARNFSTASTLSPDVVSGGFDSEDLPLPLNMTASAANSRLLGRNDGRSILNSQLFLKMQYDRLTYNSHKMGVSPDAYKDESNGLSSFFTILSTNVDRKGKPFVSTIEGRFYPIFATQWHPEKNSFEFNPSQAFPHSADAVLVSLAMSNFFVGECRKNSHAFPTAQDEEMSLIYNTEVQFIPSGYFSQIYTWDN